jgi:hypothetical protein
MWLSTLRGLAVIIPLAALGWGAPAFAQAGDPGERFRAWGEITGVEPAARAFSLHTRAGEDLRIEVNDETRFRQPKRDRRPRGPSGRHASGGPRLSRRMASGHRPQSGGRGRRGTPDRIRFHGTVETVAPIEACSDHHAWRRASGIPDQRANRFPQPRRLGGRSRRP